MRRLALLALLLALALPLSASADEPALSSVEGPSNAFLMRYADVSAEAIVFTYEGDLWRVPLAGGTARRRRRSAIRRIVGWTSRGACHGPARDGNNGGPAPGRPNLPVGVTATEWGSCTCRGR